VQGCLSLGDEALYHLARFCPDLEKINLQGCRNIQVRYRYKWFTRVSPQIPTAWIPNKSIQVKNKMYEI
jgi:hypothetical protein